MVTLPSDFTATSYDGYFWNLTEQRLYSIKVKGYLHPLQVIKPNRWNHLIGPAYRISSGGVKKNLYVHHLVKLRATNSIVRYQTRPGGTIYG